MKIEKYPEEIRDDVDKTIWDCLLIEPATRTVLKNVVYEKLITTLVGGESIDQRINRLFEKGKIKQEIKQKPVKVLSIK